jgi:hypothetical protein
VLKEQRLVRKKKEEQREKVTEPYI